MPSPFSPFQRVASAIRAGSLGIAIWCTPIPTSNAAETLDEEDFRKLHAEIRPGDEPWTSIPWQSSLVPAQHLAVSENKPLFVWAMDGHPMGCT